MTPPPKPNFFANDVARDDDIATLAPWAAAGTLSARDSRRVAAALAGDPALAADVRAARAEQAEAVALSEALGHPSARPMAALFAAIDADMARSEPSNVMRLIFDRRPSHPAGFVADFRKICGRR